MESRFIPLRETRGWGEDEGCDHCLSTRVIFQPANPFYLAPFRRFFFPNATSLVPKNNRLSKASRPIAQSMLPLRRISVSTIRSSVLHRLLRLSSIDEIVCLDATSESQTKMKLVGREWNFFLILSTRENEAEERVVGSKLNDHFFLEDFFWRIFEEKNWGNFLDSSYRFSSNLTTWIVFGRTPKKEYFLERENSISTTVAEFQITVHRASNGREMLNRFESNRVEILFSWKRVRERSKKNRSNFQRYLAIACDGRGTFVGPNRKEAKDYWSKFEKHAFQGGVYRLIARVDDREKSERANEARDKIKLEQCLPRRFSVYRILPSYFDDHARLSFIREIIYLTLWLYNFTPDSRFNAFQTL